MTKKELIEALAKYPDDKVILVNGYEDGYTKPRLEEVRVVRSSEKHEEDSCS